MNEAAIVSLRKKNYNEPSDKKQSMYGSECKQSNYFRNILLNNQEWPLRQCLVEYSCYTNHNPERGGAGNTLSVKTRCEMTENVKKKKFLIAHIIGIRFVS